MCAAMPTTSLVVTLPVTDLSSLMAMVPVPVALVVTAGTSSLPDNVTLLSADATAAGQRQRNYDSPESESLSGFSRA